MICGSIERQGGNALEPQVLWKVGSERECGETRILRGFLETWGGKPGGNLGTSMISKSQEETEVSLHLEEKSLDAKLRLS